MRLNIYLFDPGHYLAYYYFMAISLRDSKGRFIGQVKTEVETPPLNPEFEKPILQVSITNPFRKILYWLDQIRKKQTTTFMIKLSIPLIALPVFAFAFFQLGRVFPTVSTSPESTPTPVVVEEVEVSRSGVLKVAKGQATKYLLSLKDGGILLLEIPDTFDLKKYQNKQILVTGIYSKKLNILKVKDVAVIETYEDITVILQPTPTQATSSSLP